MAVLATESTVRGGAYQQAIANLRPDATVTAIACGLFVALAEEGWVDGPIAAQIARRYLEPLQAEKINPVDTLVLGCTHFPVLKDGDRRSRGDRVRSSDSAATTAASVHAELKRRALLAADAPGAAEPQLRLLATDGVERFASVGGRFLGAPLGADSVELVDF